MTHRRHRETRITHSNHSRNPAELTVPQHQRHPSPDTDASAHDVASLESCAQLSRSNPDVRGRARAGMRTNIDSWRRSCEPSPSSTATERSTENCPSVRSAREHASACSMETRIWIDVHATCQEIKTSMAAPRMRSGRLSDTRVNHRQKPGTSESGDSSEAFSVNGRAAPTPPGTYVGVP